MVSTCEQRRFSTGLLILVLLCAAGQARAADDDEDKKASPPELIRIARRRGMTRKRAEALKKLGQLSRDQNRQFNVVGFLVEFAGSTEQPSRLRRIAVRSLIRLAADVDTGGRRRALTALVDILKDAKAHTGVRIEKEAETMG